MERNDSSLAFACRNLCAFQIAHFQWRLVFLTVGREKTTDMHTHAHTHAHTIRFEASKLNNAALLWPPRRARRELYCYMFAYFSPYVLLFSTLPSKIQVGRKFLVTSGRMQRNAMLLNSNNILWYPVLWYSWQCNPTAASLEVNFNELYSSISVERDCHFRRQLSVKTTDVSMVYFGKPEEVCPLFKNY